MQTAHEPLRFVQEHTDKWLDSEEVRGALEKSEQGPRGNKWEPPQHLWSFAGLKSGIHDLGIHPKKGQEEWMSAP